MFFVHIKPKSRILLKKTKPACSIAQGHTGIPMQIYVYFSSYKRMRKYYLNPTTQKHMRFNVKTAPEGPVEHFRDVTKMFPTVIKYFFIRIDGVYENIL